MNYKVSKKKYSVNLHRTREIQKTLKEHPTWKIRLCKEYLGMGKDVCVTVTRFYDPEIWGPIEKAIREHYNQRG